MASPTYKRKLIEQPNPFPMAIYTSQTSQAMLLLPDSESVIKTKNSNPITGFFFSFSRLFCDLAKISSPSYVLSSGIQVFQVISGTNEKRKNRGKKRKIRKRKEKERKINVLI